MNDGRITGGPGTVGMFGMIGILNVGHGDTKLTFDKNNPQDCIRAARVVTDMLKRGYALLVEVEKGGVKKFVRVHKFKADTYEYIIADFDSDVAREQDAGESREEKPSTPTPKPRSKLKKGERAVSAFEGRGVAIARTAGG